MQRLCLFCYSKTGSTRLGSLALTDNVPEPALVGYPQKEHLAWGRDSKGFLLLPNNKGRLPQQLESNLPRFSSHSVLLPLLTHTHIQGAGLSRTQL